MYQGVESLCVGDRVMIVGSTGVVQDVRRCERTPELSYEEILRLVRESPAQPRKAQRSL